MKPSNQSQSTHESYFSPKKGSPQDKGKYLARYAIFKALSGISNNSFHYSSRWASFGQGLTPNEDSHCQPCRRHDSEYSYMLDRFSKHWWPNNGPDKMNSWQDQYTRGEKSWDSAKSSAKKISSKNEEHNTSSHSRGKRKSLSHPLEEYHLLKNEDIQNILNEITMFTPRIEPKEPEKKETTFKTQSTLPTATKLEASPESQDQKSKSGQRRRTREDRIRVQVLNNSQNNSHSHRIEAHSELGSNPLQSAQRGSEFGLSEDCISSTKIRRGRKDRKGYTEISLEQSSTDIMPVQVHKSVDYMMTGEPKVQSDQKGRIKDLYTQKKVKSKSKSTSKSNKDTIEVVKEVFEKYSKKSTDYGLSSPQKGLKPAKSTETRHAKKPSTLKKKKKLTKSSKDQTNEGIVFEERNCIEEEKLSGWDDPDTIGKSPSPRIPEIDRKNSDLDRAFINEKSSQTLTEFGEGNLLSSLPEESFNNQTNAPLQEISNLTDRENARGQEDNKAYESYDQVERRPIDFRLPTNESRSFFDTDRDFESQKPDSHRNEDRASKQQESPTKEAEFQFELMTRAKLEKLRMMNDQALNLRDKENETTIDIKKSEVSSSPIKEDRIKSAALFNKVENKSSMKKEKHVRILSDNLKAIFIGDSKTPDDKKKKSIKKKEERHESLSILYKNRENIKPKESEKVSHSKAYRRSPDFKKSLRRYVTESNTRDDAIREVKKSTPKKSGGKKKQEQKLHHSPDMKNLRVEKLIYDTEPLKENNDNSIGSEVFLRDKTKLVKKSVIDWSQMKYSWTVETRAARIIQRWFRQMLRSNKTRLIKKTVSNTPMSEFKTLIDELKKYEGLYQKLRETVEYKQGDEKFIELAMAFMSAYSCFKKGN